MNVPIHALRNHNRAEGRTSFYKVAPCVLEEQVLDRRRQRCRRLLWTAGSLPLRIVYFRQFLCQRETLVLLLQLPAVNQLLNEVPHNRCHLLPPRLAATGIQNIQEQRVMVQAHGHYGALARSHFQVPIQQRLLKSALSAMRPSMSRRRRMENAWPA
jgi:hypothetical protein